MDYQYYLIVTHKWYETTQGVPLPPPPPPPTKKAISDLPPTNKKTNKQEPREKMGKKRKKEGAIFANPPSEEPLVDEPLWEKARKEWPTATILNEIFEFSEIYICQKY